MTKKKGGGEELNTTIVMNTLTENDPWEREKTKIEPLDCSSLKSWKVKISMLRSRIEEPRRNWENGVKT